MLGYKPSSWISLVTIPVVVPLAQPRFLTSSQLHFISASICSIFISEILTVQLPVLVQGNIYRKLRQTNRHLLGWFNPRFRTRFSQRKRIVLGCEEPPFSRQSPVTSCRRCWRGIHSRHQRLQCMATVRVHFALVSQESDVLLATKDCNCVTVSKCSCIHRFNFES